MFGAGTGLIFILRWFWWRINAWSEIAAMFASGIIAMLFKLTAIGPYLFNEVDGIFPDWAEFPSVVLITTIIWLAVTFLTQPEDDKILRSFYKKIQPGGPGWKHVINKAEKDKVNIVDKTQAWSVPSGIVAMLLGIALIYSLLFAIGYWIYGQTALALSLTGIALVSAILLKKTWYRIRATIL